MGTEIVCKCVSKQLREIIQERANAETVLE